MKLKKRLRLAVALLALATIQEALPQAAECDNPFDVTVLYLVQRDEPETWDRPRAQAAFLEAQRILAAEMERNGYGGNRLFNFQGRTDSEPTTKKIGMWVSLKPQPLAKYTIGHGDGCLTGGGVLMASSGNTGTIAFS